MWVLRIGSASKSHLDRASRSRTSGRVLLAAFAIFLARKLHRVWSHRKGLHPGYASRNAFKKALPPAPGAEDDAADSDAGRDQDRTATVSDALRAGSTGSAGGGAPNAARNSNGIQPSSHNAQRQAMLAFARPVDHLGHCALLPDPDFSLDSTIFKSVKGPARALMTVKIGNTPHWDETRAKECRTALEQRLALLSTKVQRPVTDFKMGPILEFMNEHCDFSAEHADGSFLDHLTFCRDYSAMHWPTKSPNILFLHSIMGVGTNFFPMSKDKIPLLQDLLTGDEFGHVAAFPTVLRLLKGTCLIQDLYYRHHAHQRTTAIRFERMLDGEPVEMQLADLWDHLNFHVMHALDFLPPVGFTAQANDPFLAEFFELYLLLTRCGKLRCTVSLPDGFRARVEELQVAEAACARTNGACKLPKLMDMAERDVERSNALGGEDHPDQGLPDGWVARLYRSLPRGILRGQVVKNVKRYTKEAGRALEYEWVG